MTEQSNSLVATQDLATGLAAISGAELGAALTQAADEIAAPFTPYLYFDTTFGMFQYRDDGKKVSLPDDTEFAVNPVGIRRTLTCWVNKEVVDSLSVPFTQELPPIESLDQHGVDVEKCKADPKCQDGWRDAIVVPVVDMNTGIEYDFSAGNWTLKNSVSSMMRLIGNEIAKHDPSNECPIFSYYVTEKVNSYGKNIRKPNFELMGWRNMSEPIEPDESSSESDEEEEEEEVAPTPAVPPLPRRRAKRV